MTDRPYSPETILARVAELSALPKATPISDWKWKSAKGALQKAAGSEANRYLLLFWLFPNKWANVDAVTSNDLDFAQQRALYNWIAPYKDEFDGGKWKGHDALAAECAAILNVIRAELILPDLERSKEARKADPILAELTQPEWDKAAESVKEAVKKAAAREKNPAEDDLKADPADYPTMAEYYEALYGVGIYTMPCGCDNDSYNVIGRPICTKHAQELTKSESANYLDFLQRASWHRKSG